MFSTAFLSQSRQYQQLYAQQQTTRREDQRFLLEPLKRLQSYVQYALIEDQYNYEKAKIAYYQKFRFFQRLFSRQASRYALEHIEPLRIVFHQRTELAKEVAALIRDIESEMIPVETRSHWNGSIAVVYNPINGRAEWRECYQGGIHGVFNPLTGETEWQQALNSGIYGVFNPQTNLIEWRTFFNGGVHGVYNPLKGVVEWRTAVLSGVGGVFNPLKGKVEWKICFQGAVVGYYHHQTQCVHWIEKWQHGLALIAWDPSNNSYLTTASSGWYGDNEK